MAGLLDTATSFFADKNERKTANADNRNNQMLGLINALIANKRYDANRGDSATDYQTALSDTTSERAKSDSLIDEFVRSQSGGTDAAGNQTYFDKGSNQWVTKLSDGSRRAASAAEADEAQRLSSRTSGMRNTSEDAANVQGDLAHAEAEMRAPTPDASVISALMRKQGQEAIGEEYGHARDVAGRDLTRSGDDPTRVYSALASSQARDRADNASSSELAGLTGAEQLKTSKAARLQPMINSLVARRTATPGMNASGSVAETMANATGAQAQQSAAQRGSLGVSALAARKIATPRLNTGYQGTGTVDLVQPGAMADTVSKGKEIKGYGNMASEMAKMFMGG